MQHLKEIVLPNYPLVLSLLKYRNVWVFWNKKKSDSNRCSPLNSSIEKVSCLFLFHKMFLTQLVTVNFSQFCKEKKLTKKKNFYKFFMVKKKTIDFFFLQFLIFSIKIMSNFS